MSLPQKREIHFKRLYSEQDNYKPGFTVLCPRQRQVLQLFVSSFPAIIPEQQEAAKS